jgi:hypothetical protein
MDDFISAPTVGFLKEHIETYFHDIIELIDLMSGIISILQMYAE